MSQMLEGPASGPIRSVVYVPDDSASERPADGWPLVIFLHGRGESQQHYPAVAGSMVHGPLWRSQTEWPFVVLCPQLPMQGDRWHQLGDLKHLDAIVGAVLQGEFQVNPDQILVTGFSIGGLGCYAIAWHRQTANGWRVRKILPVDAYDPEPSWQQGKPAKGAIDVPAWSFHTSVNQDAPTLETLINPERLRAAIPPYPPPIEHWEAGRRAYQDPALYRWLLPPDTIFPATISS